MCSDRLTSGLPCRDVGRIRQEPPQTLPQRSWPVTESPNVPLHPPRVEGTFNSVILRSRDPCKSARSDCGSGIPDCQALQKMTYQAVHQGLILMQSPGAIGANPQQHNFVHVMYAELSPWESTMVNDSLYSFLECPPQTTSTSSGNNATRSNFPRSNHPATSKTDVMWPLFASDHRNESSRPCEKECSDRSDQCRSSHATEATSDNSRLLNVPERITKLSFLQSAPSKQWDFYGSLKVPNIVTHFTLIRWGSSRRTDHVTISLANFVWIQSNLLKAAFWLQ